MQEYDLQFLNKMARAKQAECRFGILQRSVGQDYKCNFQDNSKLS